MTVCVNNEDIHHSYSLVRLIRPTLEIRTGRICEQRDSPEYWLLAQPKGDVDRGPGQNLEETSALRLLYLLFIYVLYHFIVICILTGCSVLQVFTTNI